MCNFLKKIPFKKYEKTFIKQEKAFFSLSSHPNSFSIISFVTKRGGKTFFSPISKYIRNAKFHPHENPLKVDDGLKAWKAAQTLLFALERKFLR